MAAKLGADGNKMFKGNDVLICFGDQQKINRFAKYNALMDELKIELQMKKKELKGIEEALEEIELFDDDDEIPFMCGEVFLTHKVKETKDLLQTTKAQTLSEIRDMELKGIVYRVEISDLKKYLHQRFGNKICLEIED